MKSFSPLRRSIAKRILDMAESLPRFQKGTVAELQRIRERQRKMADGDYRDTRPPEGIDYEFLGFRLFEVFLVEDVDWLAKSLKRAFPSVIADTPERDFRRTVKDHSESLGSGGWWNIRARSDDSDDLDPLATRLRESGARLIERFANLPVR